MDMPERKTNLLSPLSLILFSLAAMLIGSPSAAAGTGGKFTVVVVPDTQGYADHANPPASNVNWPNRYNEHVQWIADHIKPLNIVFVSQVGDVVQNVLSKDVTEYKVAQAAWNRLHVGNDPANPALVPYCLSIGNHDFDAKCWLMNDFKLNQNTHYGSRIWSKYFGPSRYGAQKWFGGSDAGFSHTYANTIPGAPALVRAGAGLSTYQTFQAGGRSYLHISLSCGAPDGELAWADSVIAAHPGVKTIVTTHALWDGGSFLDRARAGRYFCEVNRGLRWPNGGRYQIPGNSGKEMWDKFIGKHDQIFLVLCGHTGGQATRIEKNANGKGVILMLFDRTHRRLSTDGDGSGKYRNGAGWLRTLEFDADTGDIHCRTWSTVLKEWSDNVGGRKNGRPSLHPNAYNPDCYDGEGKLVKPGQLSDLIIRKDLTIVPSSTPATPTTADSPAKSGGQLAPTTAPTDPSGPPPPSRPRRPIPAGTLSRQPDSKVLA